MMEKKFKIEHRSLCVNILLPFSIGHFDFDIECQLFICMKDDELEFDCDIIDFSNIKVMGVEVEEKHETWRNIKKSLTDLGIDVDGIISKHVDSVITKESIHQTFYPTIKLLNSL